MLFTDMDQPDPGGRICEGSEAFWPALLAAFPAIGFVPAVQDRMSRSTTIPAMNSGKSAIRSMPTTGYCFKVAKGDCRVRARVFPPLRAPEGIG